MFFSSPLLAKDSLFQAIKDGKPTVQIRLRYESVDTDPTTDVYALMARTAIGYKTEKYEGFSAYVQVEDISMLDGDDGVLDPSTPGRLPGPIIADQETGDVNMSYLQYENSGVTVVAGRQTIIHDKARHIGNVGWRMNDQTYDALTLKYKSGDFGLSLHYIWQMNRIFGTEDELDGNLAHATYKSSVGMFSVYYYGLDFDGSTNGNGHLMPAYGNVVDSDTYGIRLNGAQGDISYLVEYASQSDAYDNTLTFDTDYVHANLGYTVSGVKLSVGYESLGSDGGTASFSTPLATVHAYNGWSDRTLSLTPSLHNPNGIIDTYFTIGGKISGVKLLGTYRQLEADNGGADIGKETNLLAVYKTKDDIVLGAKIAMFDDDTAAAVDTTKTWVWAEYKF